MRRVLMVILALLMFGVMAFADYTDTNDHTDSARPVPIVQMVE